MKRLRLAAEKRTGRGRHFVGRMRKNGQVPGVVYGGSEPLSLSLDDRLLRDVLRSTAGHATLVTLEIDGSEKNCIVADFQRDPITDGLLHVDFHEIAMDRKMNAHVPIRLAGVEECEGVRLENGILESLLHQVEVHCLPANLPEEILIDVTNLHVGSAIHIRDLAHMDGVEFSGSPETVIVACSEMRVEEESAAEGGAEAGAEKSEETAAKDDADGGK